MMFSLRKLTLSKRMILVLGLMALLQTGLVGAFALHHLSRSLDEQIGQRALHVAKTIASMPSVIEAVQQRDSDFLQPLSLDLAAQTQALFVVIGDHNAIRLAHPKPERIGRSMIDDDDGDDNSPALVHGRGYITKALGSLGWSMRGKAPVYNIDRNTVVGLISVGYALSDVRNTISHYRITLILVILVAFALSVVTAAWFAQHFKRAIFGLEPEQIGQLFEERNATLESVREGIIAINADGIITTCNKAAINTLELSADTQVSGRPVTEILPDSEMLEVLKTGKPQFDREVWLQDRNLIVNRLPLKQGDATIGAVSSFRLKNELDLVSRKLTRIQQYADSLRSLSHEYSNKLHTIAGLIQIGATEKALSLIGRETRSHQALIQLLVQAVPDPVLAGCLLGKFNRARELRLNLIIDPESQMRELPDKLPREHLVSIIGNVIDNALEATLDHQGAGGEVKLSMTDLGNDLIFEVEDQGSGISPEDQQRIFEKGVTSKTQSGHGLGLHLVKKMLTQLGGMITLEPGDNTGTRFTIYIPKTLGRA